MNINSKNAKIWDDIWKLSEYLAGFRKDTWGIVSCKGGVVEYSGPPRIVCTSGGFDPLHIGHVRCMQGCKNHGEICVVIVNGNGFLKRKKGFVFMDVQERMEIIAAIQGVDHIVEWDDGDQFVGGAIEILKPQVFCKGGDRASPAQMACCELEICEKINCRIEYGVGGFEKVQSSSWLVQNQKSI